MPAAAPLDDPRSFMAWLVERAGSQAELARRSGLLPATISDYVRGENEPKLTNVLKMLRGLEIRIEGMPERDGQLARALTMLDEATDLLRRAEQSASEHSQSGCGQP